MPCGRRIQPGAAAGRHHLVKRDIPCDRKHHVAWAVEGFGAGVEQLGREPGDTLDGAGNVVPDRVFAVQAAEQTAIENISELPKVENHVITFSTGG